MALSEKAREIIMRSEYDGARTAYVLVKSKCKANEDKVSAQIHEVEKEHKN